jgi:hypothetical protein
LYFSNSVFLKSKRMFWQPTSLQQRIVVFHCV